jgi:hypothetical protein
MLPSPGVPYLEENWPGNISILRLTAGLELPKGHMPLTASGPVL